jgi:hypothetical protein
MELRHPPARQVVGVQVIVASCLSASRRRHRLMRTGAGTPGVKIDESTETERYAAENANAISS